MKPRLHKRGTYYPKTDINEVIRHLNDIACILLFIITVLIALGAKI